MERVCGAGDGTRTRDHLLGRQALYQLSYSRVGPYSIPRLAAGPYGRSSIQASPSV